MQGVVNFPICVAPSSLPPLTRVFDLQLHHPASNTGLNRPREKVKLAREPTGESEERRSAECDIIQSAHSPMSTSHLNVVSALVALIIHPCSTTKVPDVGTTQWVTVPGANLDTDGQCGCTGSACHDVKGFHYAGTLESVDACEATCAGGNCSMWFYSTHSSHCWWKLGDQWTPIATAGITAGCDASKVVGCGLLPPPPSPPPPPPPAASCTGNSTTLTTAECVAWQDFWWSARGSSWTNGGAAGRTDPCGISWPEGGVSCAQGHITRIVLPANNLTGILATSISAFLRLERLQVRERSSEFSHNLHCFIS